MANNKNEQTMLQTSVHRVTVAGNNAWKRVRGSWTWLRGSWKRQSLVGAGVVVVAGAAILAVVGLPDWEAFDNVRDAVGGKPTIAELKAKLNLNPKDGSAWVDLGHAQYEAKNTPGAIRSYARALRIEPSLASDRMIDNLMGCYGERCQASASEVIARHKLLQAEPKLEPLLRNKRYTVRWAAINTLEKLGRASNHDYLRLWTTDLTASNDCDVRRNAVKGLGKLGDRRALDEIRAAKKKDQDETPWYRPSCLGGLPDEAESQILARK